MPADLVPNESIPSLAARIDSPAMVEVLGRLHLDGFVGNSPTLDQKTAEVLLRLTELGLADPGYASSTDHRPSLWTRNGNGERVLEHVRESFESRLDIHPRARTGLATLPEGKKLAVLMTAVSLQTRDATSCPGDEALRLSGDKPTYLLRVPPDLRAFVRVLDTGRIELFDIVREETLQLFREREQEAAARQ